MHTAISGAPRPKSPMVVVVDRRLLSHLEEDASAAGELKDVREKAFCLSHDAVLVKQGQRHRGSRRTRQHSRRGRSVCVFFALVALLILCHACRLRAPSVRGRALLQYTTEHLSLSLSAHFGWQVFCTTRRISRGHAGGGNHRVWPVFEGRQSQQVHFECLYRLHAESLSGVNLSICLSPHLAHDDKHPQKHFALPVCQPRAAIFRHRRLRPGHGRRVS